MLFLRCQVMVVTGVAAWGSFAEGASGYGVWMAAMCGAVLLSVVWQRLHFLEGRSQPS